MDMLGGWNETQGIIYEDDALLVCRKPAGIAAETKRIGQQDMVSLLKNYRAAKGEPPYIGMIHRLDQPVEGLLVFAKTPEAAAALSKQVQERSIGKYYYAVGRRVDGGVCGTRGMDQADRMDGARSRCGTIQADRVDEMAVGTEIRLTDYILTDKRTNRSEIVPPDTPQAKRAELDCRVLARGGELAFFDITLHTGRHHQIRVQLAHHGWPLVGDVKYGAGCTPAGAAGHGVPSEHSGNGAGYRDVQLALCACRVVFLHPATGKEMDISIRPENAVFQPFFEKVP